MTFIFTFEIATKKNDFNKFFVAAADPTYIDT